MIFQWGCPIMHKKLAMIDREISFEKNYNKTV